MKEGDLEDCGQVQMGWREYTIIVKVFVDRQRHHFMMMKTTLILINTLIIILIINNNL